MATALEVSREHYVARQELVEATAAAGVEMWQHVDPGNLSGSWSQFMARLLVILRGAQLSAAAPADGFTTAALSAQGVRAPAEGQVVAAAFAGVASDGRALESLLLNPVIATKEAIGLGIPLQRSLATGQASLEMLLRTQVADAGRVADGVATVIRPRVGGYTRMVNLPSCSRCLILAGRVYRYDAAFERHPCCDCTELPVEGEDVTGFTTDAKAYFGSISASEQDRIFTKAGAQAIRDGADMNQVVNARRGAAGLAPAGARLTAQDKAAFTGGKRGRLRATTVYGREVFITSEGTTRRGLAGQRLLAAGSQLRVEAAETVTRNARGGAVQRTVGRARVKTPRLMPESIYQLAANREEAVRLLQRFGYIT